MSPMALRALFARRTISGGRILALPLLALTLLAGACAVPNSGPGPGRDCGPPPNVTSGAQLAGCILSGLDLSGANLDGANLKGADLSGANLTNASLVGANLEGANLSNANLTGADLSGAILSGAILLGAIFLNAIFGGTLFGFGSVFGANGMGGTSPTPPSTCVGAYCPGYNSATANTDDWLCDPNGIPGTEYVLTRTPEQLLADGQRSVVTDANTDFSGATFSDSDEEGPLTWGMDLREANFTNTTWENQIFVCQSMDGARFGGAVFKVHEWHHMSARGADFTDADFLTTYLCDSDFTGSSFVGSVWEGSNSFSCTDFVPDEELDLLPDPLVLFDDTDFSNSTMGGVPDPERGERLQMTYADDSGRTRSASFHNAVFDGVHITNGLFWDADFTDSSAVGATFTGNSQFEGVFFSPGWTDTTWIGTATFDGAACPDGSTGSPSNPCFVVTP